MRIDTFRLPAFGPFTGMEICFANQGQDLHLIHGPNEAGKSTMLRALNNLLFGFPHQTPDAHLHPAKDLAVGATLRLPDGGNLDIVRYKRRKNDLLDGAGQVLPQSSIAALMGGVSQDLFKLIFSIDQNGLRQGVEGLLQAEGDLGQALFAAASGIAGLRGILNDLENRQDGLFRPRASTSSIHQSVSELTALYKRVREHSLKPMQWEKKHQERRALSERQTILQDEIFALDTKMARLQRYRDALRHIDLREEISRQLAEAQGVRLLADDFTERRSKTQEALANAVQEEDRLTFRMEQVQTQRDMLTLNTGLLEAGEDVQRLYAEAAAHRKAIKDIRSLENRCTSLRASIADKLASLGRNKEPGQSRTTAQNTAQNTARMTRQSRVDLEKLAREYGALNADLGSATQAQDESQDDLAGLQKQFEAMPDPLDTSALEAALANAADMGNPVQRSREAAAEIEKLTSGVLRDIKTMGLWQGDPVALADLSLPLRETLDRFEADMHSAQAHLGDAQKEMQRLETALREKKSTLTRLEAFGDLPDPSALDKARSLRDTGWGLIKNAWLLSTPDAAQAARFTAQFSGTDSLAEAFEKSLRQADALADTMFTNASNVAQAAGLRREIASLQQDAQNAADQVEHKTLALEKLQTLWAEQWRPAHISPLPPREMQAWLTKALDVRQRLSNLHERETARRRLDSDMQAVAAQLGQALASADRPLSKPVEYASVQTLAGQTLTELKQQAVERQDLRYRIQDATRVRDRAGVRRNQAVAALKAWEERWAKALQSIELPVETTPEAAAAVALTLEEIDQARRELDGLEQRIAEMDEEYREFARQVLNLKNLSPFDVPDLPEDIIGRLHAQWQTEKENKAKIEDLAEEQRQIKQQLHTVRKTSQACEKTLAGLCAEAGCSFVEELPALEARARAKAQTLNERNSVKERLLELAGGEDLEAFIASAREYQPDELSAELERIRVEKTELSEQRDECTVEIGRIRGELAGLDGSSLAAETTQQISEVNARLAEEVRQFVLLRLASQVLSKAIERYREANQGPVLAAASRYFAAMTLGSFSGLLADYDDKGDPVIKAVRDADRRLEINQLSEGTRDQLFLALRLGGLWRYVQGNPPLPLIVDDILVNFDDQRSAATFRVFAQIASFTQVLFFTHHSHLVDIAREALPGGVKVIRLVPDCSSSITSPSSAAPPPRGPIC